MPIYDRPTKVLMQEFAKAELTPGKAFDWSLAVKWFAEHYPRIKSATVKMHVDGMAINSPVRVHHKGIRPNSGHNLFFKLGPGQFRLWDPAHDTQPIYRGDGASSGAGSRSMPSASAKERSEESEEAEAAFSKEFGAEADLQNYLVKNLSALEPGLTLYEDEGLEGIEFPAGNRRIDILARGADGAYVVIELKVSRGYDRVVGQILRYMGWVEQNLAEGKLVRGIIVASDISDDLKLATARVAGIKLVEYELSFKLNPVNR